MASIGQPIDRVDGRLKVDRPRQLRRRIRGSGCRACGAGAEHDRRRHDHRLRSRRGAGDAGRAGDHHAGQCAEAADEGRRAADGPLAAAAGPCGLLQRPACRGCRGRHARPGATQPRPLVRVRYRRDEPVTSMDAVLGAGLSAEAFRNGERPPDSRRGDPDAAFDTAAVKVDATYITPIEHHNPMEPHATIARWDGDRLTVWNTTQGISGAQQTLAGCSGSTRGCAGDLPLSRRRLRLQGQHLAACDARRDGGERGRPAGEARGDAGADVHLQRLSAAHHAEVAVRRRRSGPSGGDAA